MNVTAGSGLTVFEKGSVVEIERQKGRKPGKTYIGSLVSDVVLGEPVVISTSSKKKKRSKPVVWLHISPSLCAFKTEGGSVYSLKVQQAEYM